MESFSIVYFIAIIIGVVKLFAKFGGDKQKKEKTHQEVKIPQVQRMSTMPTSEIKAPQVNQSQKANTTPTYQPQQKYERTEKQSTMDYLNEKSKLGAKEKLMENQRVENKKRQEIGNKRIGERLYLGDPIPNGKIVVKCSYCGADNLLPQEAREPYLCYFCREVL